MRGQIDEQWMKLVMKKYPGTKWADLAAFHLLENKLCGDWQGASKCPDKEADMYEKYAKEHEQSPAAPDRNAIGAALSTIRARLDDFIIGLDGVKELLERWDQRHIVTALTSIHKQVKRGTIHLTAPQPVPE